MGGLETHLEPKRKLRKYSHQQKTQSKATNVIFIYLFCIWFCLFLCFFFFFLFLFSSFLSVQIPFFCLFSNFNHYLLSRFLFFSGELGFPWAPLRRFVIFSSGIDNLHFDNWQSMSLFMVWERDLLKIVFSVIFALLVASSFRYSLFLHFFSLLRHGRRIQGTC